MGIEFGKRLKRFRTDAHLTQEQVSKVLKINRTTYTYYELGKTEPSISSLGKLTKLLNVSYEQLMPDPDNMAVKQPSLHERKSQKEKIYDLSKEEQDLILKYRSLSKEEKENLIKDMDKR